MTWDFEKLIDENYFKQYAKEVIKPSIVRKEIEESRKGLFLSHVNGPNNIHLFWYEGMDKRYVWYNKSNGENIYYKEMNNDISDLPVGRIFRIDKGLAYAVIEDFSNVDESVLTKYNLSIDANPAIVEFSLK